MLYQSREAAATSPQAVARPKLVRSNAAPQKQAARRAKLLSARCQLRRTHEESRGRSHGSRETRSLVTDVTKWKITAAAVLGNFLFCEAISFEGKW